jgi:hypothetical protein
MKGILEFNLENFDERREHLRCVKSTDMALFIWELKHNFWRKWKHDESNFTLDNYKDELMELMESHNINIDELIE